MSLPFFFFFFFFCFVPPFVFLSCIAVCTALGGFKTENADTSPHSLTNYRVKDQNHGGPAGKYGFDNMELIRSFEDAQGSERGFM